MGRGCRSPPSPPPSPFPPDFRRGSGQVGAQRAQAGAGTPAGGGGCAVPPAAGAGGTRRRHPGAAASPQPPDRCCNPFISAELDRCPSTLQVRSGSDAAAAATCGADFARGCWKDFLFRRQLKNTSRRQPTHWLTRWKLDRERLAACRRLATKLFGRKR